MNLTMTSINDHPRLTRAPLVEAVFDLRYNTNIPLETIRTSIKEHLPEFKIEERLEGKVVALQIGPEGEQSFETTTFDNQQDLLQHRFRNPDTDELIQLGHGIISVNTIKYEGFRNFFSTLENVILKHGEIATPNAYRRLALRYVNHLSLEDIPERVFAWLAPIPQTWGTRSTIQNVQQMVLRIGEDVQNVTIAYPQINLNTGKNIMILDIDHHLDFVLPVLPNIDNIHDWVNQAHEQVYKTFLSVLKPDYLKELT